MVAAMSNELTWFQRRKLHRAAESYAKRLGPRLAEDYGGSEFYTMAQIDTVIEKLDLDTAHLAIAYAAFLPREEYEEYFTGLVNRFSYTEARTIYLEHAPVLLDSRAGNRPQGAPYSGY